VGAAGTEGILLVGCGGHARSVADSALAGGLRIAGFVAQNGAAAFSCRGIGTIGHDDDLPGLRARGYGEAFVSIGYLGRGTGRQEIAGRLARLGFGAARIIDPTAAVSEDAEVSAGVFVGKNAVVNAAAAVGDHAIVNSGAIVEHDCRVGAFSHIAVGAVLGGGAHIGSGCLIGAHATVLQGLSVGDGAVVGAGAVVTEDIPPGAVAVGVPARIRNG
jgi:UDP-perosamine 4-acetyltransferase